MTLEPGPLFLSLGPHRPGRRLTFRIERPFGLPDAARERLLITNPTSTLVFRVSDQAYADIRQPFRLFLAGQPTPVCLTVKAQPRAFVTYTNGVVVNASAGRQVLNYLNPGGQVPGWILDAVTAKFSSPFDKQLGFGSLDPC